jgi:hypothetical protein
MLFRTYEHYPHNEVYYNIIIENYENNYDNMCIICFDNNSLLNELINLNMQTLYIKQCNCNARIHYHCLGIWHERTQKCPICRSLMIAKSGPLNKITALTIKCIKMCLIVFYYLSVAHFICVAYWIVDSYFLPGIIVKGR